MVDINSTGLSFSGMTDALESWYISPYLLYVQVGLCYGNPGVAHPISNELPHENGYTPYFTPPGVDFFGGTHTNYPPPPGEALNFYRQNDFFVTWTATADWVYSAEYWYVVYHSTLYPAQQPKLLSTGQFKSVRPMKAGDILYIPPEQLTIAIKQRLDEDL